MILPTKVIKPVESLYCISAYVVDILITNGGLDFDDLLDSLNQIYPIEITIEKLQYCLDFLFMLGKLELENETLKTVVK
ncbi:ABC-three component system middle component 6 [Vibrio splendidus]